MAASTLEAGGLVYNNTNTKKASAVTVTADYTNASLKSSSYGSSVVTITAARDKAIYIQGNAKANKISGTAANDTLAGEAGNDTLTGNGGKDVFIYDGKGTDVIADYTAGEDTIKIASGSISSYSFSGSDAVFKVGSGSVKVKGGKSSAITVVDSKNKTFTYDGGLIYNNTPAKASAITVTAAYGNTLSANGYGSNVVTIDSSARTKALNIAGNDKANKITGTSGNDTLNGGKGNDTLTGGKGKDIFIYESGGGNDVIADYAEGQDTIKITSGEISAYSISGSDASFKIGTSTLKVKGGKSSAITVIDADKHVSTYQNGAIYNNSKPAKAIAVTLTSAYANSITAASSVITVDASPRTAAIKIVGNTKNNILTGGAGKDVIDGGKGNDSIVGGKGGDTLTGGAGSDVFIYANGDGSDLIMDYVSGEDVIKLTSGEVKSYSVKNGDAILKVGSGAITIKGAGYGAVSVLDAEDVLTVYNGGLIYNDPQVSKADVVSVTADYEGEFNSYGASVETIDAAIRTKALNITGNAADNYILGGKGKDTITGGKGADTILGGKNNDILTGGAGADVFSYATGDGNDTITDYAADEDVISLSSGTLTSYSTKNGDAILKIGAGTITVKDAADLAIRIVGEDGTASIASGGTIELAAEENSGGTFIIPSDALNYNGNYYYVYDNGLTWSEAKTFAENLGGHLLTITDSSEQAAIENLLASHENPRNSYWMGGYKDTDDLWKWSTGENWSYDNWAKNQPDNAYGLENRLMMYYSTTHGYDFGSWNDLREDGEFDDEKFFGVENFGLIVEWDTAAKNSVTGSIITGTSGDDTLAGTYGNDTVTGYAGDDTFVYEGGGDYDIIADYGDGDDKISLGANSVSGAMVIGSDVIFAIGDGLLKLLDARNKRVSIISNDSETTYLNGSILDYDEVTLTDGNDDYTNGKSKRIIYALAGNDTVINYGSVVSVHGGDGVDNIINDVYSFESTLNGGAGSDQIRNYSASGNVYQLSAGTDTVWGYNENDTVYIAASSYTTSKSGNNFVIKAGSDSLVLRHAANFPVIVADSTGAVQTYNASGSRVLNGDTVSTEIVNTNSHATINGSASYNIINNYGSSVLAGGGAGVDYITNHGDSVTIVAGAEEDYIWNYGAAATINAGKGNDRVYLNSSDGSVFQYATGDGNDVVYNLSASDTVNISGASYTTAQSGSDIIVSVGSGKITLAGAGSLSAVNIVGDSDTSGGGGDSDFTVVSLTTGDDRHTVTASKQIVYALAGNDTVYSESLASVAIFGEAGDDSILNSGSSVTIDGGADNDFIGNWYGDSVTIDGGTGNDYINNYSGNSVTIDGGDGNDNIYNDGDSVTIDSGDGNDSIYNYGSNVTIDGGEGNDRIINDGDSVTIYGGEGNDSIDNDGDSVTINGGAGADTIHNYYSQNSINGGAGADLIRLYSNHYGGIGNNTIAGGKGNDFICFVTDDIKNNLIQYSSGDGDDTIRGYDFSDTIQIINGSYSTQVSGSDVIVSVGSGSITIRDYTGTVNIQSVSNGNAAVEWFNEDDTLTTGGELDALVETSIANSAGDISMRGGDSLTVFAPEISYADDK